MRCCLPLPLLPRMEGVRKKTKNLPARSWGGACGKWQRWTGDNRDDGGDSGSDEGEEEDVNSRKLYIKVLESLRTINVPASA